MHLPIFNPQFVMCSSAVIVRLNKIIRPQVAFSFWNAHPFTLYANGGECCWSAEEINQETKINEGLICATSKNKSSKVYHILFNFSIYIYTGRS